jgi:hypothetical protein
VSRSIPANGSVKRNGSVWSFVVGLGPGPGDRSGFATKKAAEAALRDLATAAGEGTPVSHASR